MGEWRECKLGDVVEINMGQSPSSEHYNSQENGLPFLQGNKTFGIKYPSFDTYCKSPLKIARKGDVLMSVRAPVGALNIANKDICIGRGLCSLRAKNRENTFLFYLLCFLKDIIVSSETGTVFGSVSKSIIENIDVVLPPLPEQKAIAGVLSSLDDKIDLLHRQNKTLEALAETIWRKMFVENADPCWKQGKLGDIAEINPLRTIGKNETSLYLDMSNMPTDGPFPKGWIRREFTSGIKFKNGDTIIARITPCLENGKTAFVNFLDDKEIGWGSTEYIVMSAKITYCQEWFYFLARSPDFRDYAIQNMTGTSGRQRVSGDAIAHYEMALPPPFAFDKFRTFAEPVMKHIRHNSFQIGTLAKLRDTLLPKLMSGEVRVAL